MIVLVPQIQLVLKVLQVFLKQKVLQTFRISKVLIAEITKMFKIRRPNKIIQDFYLRCLVEELKKKSLEGWLKISYLTSLAVLTSNPKFVVQKVYQKIKNNHKNQNWIKHQIRMNIMILKGIQIVNIMMRKSPAARLDLIIFQNTE